MLSFRETRLLFDVDQDGECIGLRFTSKNGALKRVPKRTEASLLLALARRRLADTDAGIPDDNCGWVTLDELTQHIPAGLNIYVFRIRRLFQALGIADAVAIIERRLPRNEFRIGTPRIEVRIIGGGH
jgi:hypothetical protein